MEASHVLAVCVVLMALVHRQSVIRATKLAIRAETLERRQELRKLPFPV